MDQKNVKNNNKWQERNPVTTFKLKSIECQPEQAQPSIHQQKLK